MGWGVTRRTAIGGDCGGKFGSSPDWQPLHGLSLPSGVGDALSGASGTDPLVSLPSDDSGLSDLSTVWKIEGELELGRDGALCAGLALCLQCCQWRRF